MTYLARRIYDLRTQKGLKQDELAEALGVSRQAISKWEMGTGTPTLENLVAISNYFGVSLDSLVKDPAPAEAETETPPPPVYRPELGRKKETTPPTKTLVNAAVLIAAYLFSFAIVNGIEYFLTVFMGNRSLEALRNYAIIQPYLGAALNIIFSAPLYYFMTAVFRDGAYLFALGRGYKSRLPDVLGLWLISLANIAATGIVAQSSSVFAYYRVAPFLNCAVYLIFYLILTRARGFNRRLSVLLPTLGAMILAAAVFALIIIATESSESLSTGERLARISWTMRASGLVTAAVSLASLTVLYDYGRKEA